MNGILLHLSGSNMLLIKLVADLLLVLYLIVKLRLSTSEDIVRLLFYVTPWVFDKIAPWAEFFLAPFMLTLIRPLSSMSPQMNLKVPFLIKDLAASIMRADKSERNSSMLVL